MIRRPCSHGWGCLQLSFSTSISSVSSSSRTAVANNFTLSTNIMRRSGKNNLSRLSRAATAGAPLVYLGLRPNFAKTLDTISKARKLHFDYTFIISFPFENISILNSSRWLITHHGRGRSPRALLPERRGTFGDAASRPAPNHGWLHSESIKDTLEFFFTTCCRA